MMKTEAKHQGMDKIEENFSQHKFYLKQDCSRPDPGTYGMIS